MIRTFQLELTSPEDSRIERRMAGNPGRAQIREEDIRVKTLASTFCEGCNWIPFRARFMFHGPDRLLLFHSQSRFIGNMMILKMAYFNSISPNGNANCGHFTAGEFDFSKFLFEQIARVDPKWTHILTGSFHAD
jgi:hypothetical protein